MDINYNSVQAVYDHVCRHIAAQGFRAMNAASCRYRDLYGASCAVGCLIRDEDYLDKMEGFGVINSRNLLLLPRYLWPHLDLLIELQSAHDYAWNWENSGVHMERQLAAVAYRFKLDSSILDRLDFGTIIPDRLY